jgi:hypothetical protein
MSSQYTKIRKLGERGIYTVTTVLPSGIPSTSYTFRSEAWENTLFGVRFPNWRSRVKSGLNATTVMTAESRSLSIRDGKMKVSGWTNPNHNDAFYTSRELSGWIHQPTWPGTPTNLDLNEAQRSALIDAYRDARNQTRSLQGGTLIGEMGQSIRMLKGRAKQMVGVISDWHNRLRKRKRRRPRENDKSKLQRANDAYLEFTFGWNPLVRDCVSAMKNWKEPRWETREFQGFGRSSSTQTVSSGDTTIGAIVYDYTIIDTAQVRYKYYGAVSAVTGGAGSWVERLGLAPHDFIPTLYELLPWSFVFDYFTDLGSAVEALSFPRSTIRWVAHSSVKETIRKFHTHNMRHPSIPDKDVEIRLEQAYAYDARRRVVNRSPMITLPLVPPSIHLPGYHKKWLNLSSLTLAKAFRM